MHYSERFTHISSLNRKRGTPVKFSAFEIHVTDEETETQRIHPATVAIRVSHLGNLALLAHMASHYCGLLLHITVFLPLHRTFFLKMDFLRNIASRSRV
jgi:hypothetical protein